MCRALGMQLPQRVVLESIAQVLLKTDRRNSDFICWAKQVFVANPNI